MPRFRSALTRRMFVGGLLAAPALRFAGARSQDADSQPPSERFRRPAPPITSPDQVLNVADFEALARAALPPAHFGYIATGADDDRTAIRNCEAFSHYEIRAHRFNDVSRLDTSVKVFGERLPGPIYLSAVSAMRAFHPEGELAVARAARTRATKLMVSTGTSTPIEALLKERGAPAWQQLYPTDDWAVTTAIIRRAEKAGCSAIVLTTDSPGARNNETLKRAMAVDDRHCVDCHAGNSHDIWRRGPMFANLDVSRVTTLAPQGMPPAYLDRVRGAVKTRLILKGIVTGEDALTAIDHGADAIIVSNHGGRNEETLHSTIDCLSEVVVAANNRVPVFFDGGIRRGTDVFKALALGATAVGIGRPQAWGLAAFGQPGVEAVLDILQRELLIIMRQAGTASRADIKRELLVSARQSN